MKMSAIKSTKRSINYYSEEPPEKKLESEGDILLKELFKKQQNKQINLQEQLLHTKEFAKSTEFLPLTSFAIGTHNLKEFETIVEQSEQFERCKAAGLTDDDVQLLSDYKKGEKFLFEKHKNYEKALLKERLNNLLDVIRQSENERFRKSNPQPESNVNRHKTEFALSLKPNSVETKLLKFALESRKNGNKTLPHPMDNLKQIERECFSDRPLPSLRKIQKKARNLARKIENVGNDVQTEAINRRIQTNPGSKWDVKDIEVPKERNFEVKHYTCRPQNFYTVKDGEIVRLESLPSKSLVDFDPQKRLSVEAIKQLPKFSDYEAGNPSKVLYIKNIHKDVKQNDLETIFKDFLTSTTSSVKLLTGKMRGQAFVTLSDEETASRAIRKINGLLINLKPIIVQYGKRK